MFDSSIVLLSLATLILIAKLVATAISAGHSVRRHMASRMSVLEQALQIVEGCEQLHRKQHS